MNRLNICLFIVYTGGTAFRVTVITVENGVDDPSSNSGGDCVSLHANAQRKGIEPSVFFSSVSK